MWIMQCCQSEWKHYSFVEISRMAEQSPSRGLYVDPDAERFFNPSSMSHEISLDIEERYAVTIDPDDVGSISRIAFESLALKYDYVLKNLGILCGIPAARLFIVGGGCQNVLLNRLAANACGIPVYAGIPEASVVGNVLCQMLGMGEIFGEEQAKRIVADTFPVTEYLPQDDEQWKKRRAQFAQDLHLG